MSTINHWWFTVYTHLPHVANPWAGHSSGPGFRSGERQVVRILGQDQRLGKTCAPFVFGEVIVLLLLKDGF